VPNRQKTTMYHAQFMGRYTFPADLAVAVNYRLQSGFPFARYVDAGATTTPSLNMCNFNCTFFVENLDRNRSEAVNLMNIRLDKSFSVGDKKFTAMLDIDNVLNADPVTNFNLASDSFKTVIATLDPRVFQVGFRFEF